MTRKVALFPLVPLHDQHEPSAWLHGRIMEVVAGLRAGLVPTCGHLREGESAGVSLCDDVPRAMCWWCATALGTGEPAPTTCTRCGVAGMPLIIDLFITPTLVFAFTLCGLCQQREVVQ